MSKTTNFNADDLAAVNAAPTMEAAQELLHAIVDKAAVSKSPIKPEKVTQLHTNINHARNKAEVVQIGWNMLMVGEGLGAINSKYQRKFA